MTDLNELFKVIAEGKKQYEDTDPVGQQIKQAKEHVKEDLSSLFAQLSTLKEDLEKELVVEEAKLVSLIDSDSIKRDAKNIVNEVFGQIKKPMITEEIPAQPIIHTPEVRAKQVDADVDKYLTDKSFQQPNPDLVTKNIDDIRNKIKFLEQAIGRVAAAGPGGGEVNLRYLDDVDRSTITDGWYLRYSATKKKFEFAEVISSGGNGATGPAGATGPGGGDAGATGVTGSSGAQGASGLNGSTGPTGASGVSGASGVLGASGSNGASGINGASGASGAAGTQGASGVAGASGTQGIDGASGVDGATGISGASGVNGSTGPTGASGIDGASGIQGASGSIGLTGATGVGVQGASGSTGLTGATGLTGSTGPAGASGAVGYYGSFYDLQDRIAAAEDVSAPIQLDHTSETNGVQLLNGSQVKVLNAGVYNVQFSCQLHNTGGGGDGTVVNIWLAKNGTAIPDTATNVTVNSNSPFVVPAWNFVLSLEANDYVELYWQTENVNIIIEHAGATGVQGATGFSPAIPSTILTITQVAYALTGASGATGTQGASGSMGATGIGLTGASGIQGASGISGASGFVGSNGATGIQGASGSTGITGASGVQGASGSTGSQGASGIGSTGAQGASGSTGLTGATGNSVAASYLKYTRSAAQTTGLTAGSRVICNVSENTAGSDITIDTSTGAITLAANKTYRLRGAVPNWYGGSRPSFCWYNEATSAYIGEASFHYVANDGAAYAAGAGMAEAIITTSSSTVVSFRIQSVVSALTGLGGNIDFPTAGSYPWVDVEVISGNSPLLNGATGATGIQGASGSTGLTGATGPAVSLGPINWVQSFGASGFSGATGATGAVFTSASITGLGGPIEVTVYGDANPLVAGGWGKLQIYRDTTPIGTPINFEGSASNENNPYALHVIDNPGAGTFSYTLRLLVNAGGGVQFGETGTCTWTVKELSNVRGATGAQGVQGATGPGMTYASGYVNAGTFVTLDNIKATVTTSGSRGLALATVSGTVSALIGGYTTYAAGSFTYNTTNGASPYSITTSTGNTSIFGWGFFNASDTAIYHVNDLTNSKFYRITMMIGGGYNNNPISIERLI